MRQRKSLWFRENARLQFFENVVEGRRVGFLICQEKSAADQRASPNVGGADFVSKDEFFEQHWDVLVSCLVDVNLRELRAAFEEIEQAVLNGGAIDSILTSLHELLAELARGRRSWFQWSASDAAARTDVGVDVITATASEKRLFEGTVGTRRRNSSKAFGGGILLRCLERCLLLERSIVPIEVVVGKDDAEGTGIRDELFELSEGKIVDVRVSACTVERIISKYSVKSVKRGILSRCANETS